MEDIGNFSDNVIFEAWQQHQNSLWSTVFLKCVTARFYIHDDQFYHYTKVFIYNLLCNYKIKYSYFFVFVFFGECFWFLSVSHCRLSDSTLSIKSESGNPLPMTVLFPWFNWYIKIEWSKVTFLESLCYFLI
jgi:hypothetical protein